MFLQPFFLFSVFFSSCCWIFTSDRHFTGLPVCVFLSSFSSCHIDSCHLIFPVVLPSRVFAPCLPLVSSLCVFPWSLCVSSASSLRVCPLWPPFASSFCVFTLYLPSAPSFCGVASVPLGSEGLAWRGVNQWVGGVCVCVQPSRLKPSRERLTMCWHGIHNIFTKAGRRIPEGAPLRRWLPGILAPDLVTRKKKQTRARHRPPRDRRASKKASSNCHTSHNGLSPGKRNPEGHHTKDPSPKFSGEGQRGGTLKWFPRLPLPLLACGLAHQKSKQSRK